MNRWPLAVLLALSACGSSPAPLETSEVQAPPNHAGSRLGADLLALDAEGHVYALRIDDGALVSHRFDSESVEHPPACARDGSQVIVAEAGRIVAAPAFANEPRVEVTIPGDPVLSLHCQDLQCLVGREGRVERIDLRRPQPSLQEVHRVSHDAKPIDFFVRLAGERGERIVGVDDFRMPKWALVFDSAGGFLFSTSLPEETNEAFVAAAASGEAMWLVGNGNTISDRYNRVHRCELSGDSFECETVEESQRHGGPTTLFAGEEFTPLSGLAPVDGAAFVCAGARGLLRFFADGSDVQVLPETAGCLDAVSDDSAIYALVDEGRALSLRARDGAEIGRHPLTPPMTRLAGVSNR